MITIKTSPQPSFTPGILYIDGKMECFTLDWPLSGGKYDGVPPGKYQVYPYYSPHLKRMVLRFVNVPGRDAIEIHNGNSLKDSEGCILVGQSRNADGSQVWNSVKALDALLLKVTETTDLEIV